MQPFDGIIAPPNPHPQEEQSPQSQQNDPFAPQQPNPAPYQPPFAFQQPGGYPINGDQSKSMAYNQGFQQARNSLHRQLLAQELGRNIKATGKGLVALFSLFMVTVSVGGAFVYGSQTNYSLTATVYNKITVDEYNVLDTFSSNSCQAFLGGILGVPYFLLAFGIFNFLALWISATGLTCCMFIQAFCALLWAGLAAFISQQKCVGQSILTTAFGANNIPQNAWPYYAAMALASFVACVLNCNWSHDKDRAERDQQNLALIMASS